MSERSSDATAFSWEGWVKQPNSKHCYACGKENSKGLALEFFQNEAGEVMCRIAFNEPYQGYPGIVHGGVLSTVLDEVVGRAAMVEDPNRFMVTAKLNLRFRKSVPLGETVQVVGRLIKQRRNFALSTAEIYLPDGSVAIEAEATLVDHPLGEADAELLEDLGWKVYPE